MPRPYADAHFAHRELAHVQAKMARSVALLIDNGGLAGYPAACTALKRAEGTPAVRSGGPLAGSDALRANPTRATRQPERSSQRSTLYRDWLKFTLRA